jgi:hypothetical protein
MYDGGDRKPEQPGSPEPSGSTVAPWTDRFLGRVLVQAVGMLGVAALVVSVVDDRAAETEARMAALDSKLELVTLERDRMQRLSHELATELDDVAMEAEIVRWQLAYTEERFARSEAERSGVGARPVLVQAWTAGPSATFASLDPVDALSPDAAREIPGGALAEPIAVVAAAMSDSMADGPMGFGVLPSVAEERATGGMAMLELDSIADASSVKLKLLGSQLDRDQAFAEWSVLLEEAAAGECRGRGVVAERRCRDEVRRELWSSGGRAVDCIMSGNASPDYVADIRFDQLPTHSKPLEKGAVIFCDGGLRNL